MTNLSFFQVDAVLELCVEQYFKLLNDKMSIIESKDTYWMMKGACLYFCPRVPRMGSMAGRIKHEVMRTGTVTPSAAP